jgi:hypothetical protein
VGRAPSALGLWRLTLRLRALRTNARGVGCMLWPELRLALSHRLRSADSKRLSGARRGLVAVALALLLLRKSKDNICRGEATGVAQ